MENEKIEIRPIVSEDEVGMRNFYEKLSEETFRSFYRGPKNRKVSERQWEILKENDFDPEKYLLFGAFRESEIVGLAMLMRIFPQRNEYEIGFLVSDRFQKKGMGESLMHALLLHAMEHSVVGTLVAHTTFMNVGAKKLLRKFGFTLVKIDEEELFWTCKVFHE